VEKWHLKIAEHDEGTHWGALAMEEQPEGGKKKIGLPSTVLVLVTKYPLILNILQFSTVTIFLFSMGKG